MPSPLADIDWTDLDSGEMTTAVFLLCKALQERYNIGRSSITGSFFNNPGEPHRYTFPSTATPNPSWELNDGDPLEDWSQEVEDLFEECIRFYIDTDKNDALIGSAYNANWLKTYADDADAPLTYANRLFEKTGYTSYPDLSVYAPEEVKKFYDMVTTLKVTHDTYVSTIGTRINDNYLIFDGEFDKDQSTGFGIDETGADYYGGATRGEGGEAVTNTTPFTDFKTGNGNLFGSGTTSFNEDTDTGTAPNWYTPYKLNVGRLSSGGNYWNWMRSARVTFVVDWTDVENNLGITGRPLDYDESIDYINTITENYPTGQDPATGTPAGEDVVYRRSIESVTTNVNKISIEVNDQITVGTMPTNITDLSNGDIIDVEIVLGNNIRGIFYENWDGDGGFEYYTP